MPHKKCGKKVSAVAVQYFLQMNVTYEKLPEKV